METLISHMTGHLYHTLSEIHHAFSSPYLRDKRKATVIGVKELSTGMCRPDHYTRKKRKEENGQYRLITRRQEKKKRKTLSRDKTDLKKRSTLSAVFSISIPRG